VRRATGHQDYRSHAATRLRLGRIRVRHFVPMQLFFLACSAAAPVAPQLSQLAVNPGFARMALGEELELTAVATVNSGVRIVLDNQQLLWHSQSPDIVTVDSVGQVRALAPGTTTVRVMTNGQASSQLLSIGMKVVVEPSNRQTQEILLTVVDEESQAPIEGATVILHEWNQAVVTDHQGLAQVDPPGAEEFFTLTAIANGYDRLTIAPVTLRTIRIPLSPAPRPVAIAVMPEQYPSEHNLFSVTVSASSFGDLIRVGVDPDARQQCVFLPLRPFPACFRLASSMSINETVVLHTALSRNRPLSLRRLDLMTIPESILSQCIPNSPCSGEELLRHADLATKVGLTILDPVEGVCRGRCEADVFELAAHRSDERLPSVKILITPLAVAQSDPLTFYVAMETDSALILLAERQGISHQLNQMMIPNTDEIQANFPGARFIVAQESRQPHTVGPQPATQFLFVSSQLSAIPNSRYVEPPPLLTITTSGLWSGTFLNAPNFVLIPQTFNGTVFDPRVPDDMLQMRRFAWVTPTPSPYRIILTRLDPAPLEDHLVRWIALTSNAEFTFPHVSPYGFDDFLGPFATYTGRIESLTPTIDRRLDYWLADAGPNEPSLADLTKRLRAIGIKKVEFSSKP